MLFDRNIGRDVPIAKVLYSPKHGFQFEQSHYTYCGNVRARKSLVDTDGLHVVGMWRFPAGTHSVVEYMAKFHSAFNAETGYYELTRNDVWELYTAWRKAYASGYDCSLMFNVFGVPVQNPLIPAARQLTFDIRLGTAISADRTARMFIGTGRGRFSPQSPSL